MKRAGTTVSPLSVFSHGYLGNNQNQTVNKLPAGNTAGTVATAMIDTDSAMMGTGDVTIGTGCATMGTGRATMGTGVR